MTMIGQIMLDSRHQRPLPLSISLHGKAYQKFIEILKSKSAYFPQEDGTLKFLTVPIYFNNKLPFGCFTVERIKEGDGMLVKR